MTRVTDVIRVNLELGRLETATTQTGAKPPWAKRKKTRGLSPLFFLTSDNAGAFSLLSAWNTERQNQNSKCCMRVYNLCVEIIRLQESPVTIYQTGSKQELHLVYVAELREKIELLENQKAEIDKELIELRKKLSDNENYEPPEE